MRATRNGSTTNDAEDAFDKNRLTLAAPFLAAASQDPQRKHCDRLNGYGYRIASPSVYKRRARHGGFVSVDRFARILRQIEKQCRSLGVDWTVESPSRRSASRSCRILRRPKKRPSAIHSADGLCLTPALGLPSIRHGNQARECARSSTSRLASKSDQSIAADHSPFFRIRVSSA